MSESLHKSTPHSSKSVDEQLAYIRKGAAEIIPEAELRAKLEQSVKSGKPLRVYLGVDPTAPDIHLGHTVVLRKLKHFQDMGHTAIFLIGDFSAMIGDPTGQSETRPPLSREQVDANAKTYLAQVYKILDPEKTEVRYNSEWLGKMSSYDVVRLCGHYRLARMLEREDFRSRLERNLPISVHELLYPLLTACDAVELKSDVELGATEQKFNILVHREIQREYGLSPQVVFTMPILVGLDGAKKMSKSLGNYVGITEAPKDMFGKLMSISDDLMWSYYELLTDRTSEELTELRRQVESGERLAIDVKEGLAIQVVNDFHGMGIGYSAAGYVSIPSPGEAAANKFRHEVRERQAPESMKEIWIKRAYDGTHIAYEVIDGTGKTIGSFPSPLTGKEKWTKVLFTLSKIESIPEFSQISSVSDAERLIKGGSLEVNNKVVRDPTSRLDLTRHGEFVVCLGKRRRFLRVIVQ